MKKILFTLLFLIAGAAIGSGITFVITNDDTTPSNKTNQDSQEESINEEESNTPVGITEFYPNSIAVLVDGEVYVNVYGSTLDIDNLYGTDTYQTLINTRNTYQTVNFPLLNYKDETNQSFTGMKLNTSNVKEIYAFASGQTFNNNYGLILLNEDGTVSIISLYSLITGNQNVTTIESLANITSISSSNDNGYTTYATDEQGMLYNMNDYIPTDYTLW
ncbi:MAG TPA: hypothetical protein IAB45_02340 [Candidatus Onthousia faecavium]|nr:hypothetical protein [Candidatus Onthousia faecavium]